MYIGALEPHMGVAKHLAFKFINKHRWKRDPEDIVQAAYMGLIKARDSFKKELGYTFTTWAYIKINYSIIDYCRTCSALGNTKAKKRPMTETINNIQMNAVPDLSSTDFVDDIDKNTIINRVLLIVNKLPESQKNLIIKMYIEGKPLTQASKEIGMCKSWASRLAKEAIDTLRKDLLSTGELNEFDTYRSRITQHT